MVLKFIKKYIPEKEFWGNQISGLGLKKFQLKAGFKLFLLILYVVERKQTNLRGLYVQNDVCRFALAGCPVCQC